MTLGNCLSRLDILRHLITPAPELLRETEAVEYTLYVHGAVKRHYEATGTTVLFPDEAAPADTPPVESSEEEVAPQEAPRAATPDPRDPATWDKKTRNFIKAAYEWKSKEWRPSGKGPSVDELLEDVGEKLGYSDSTAKRRAKKIGLYVKYEGEGAPTGREVETRLRAFKERVRKAYETLPGHEGAMKLEGAKNQKGAS